MLTIKVDVDSAPARGLAEDLGKRLPKVMADTCNVLAGRIKDATIEEMKAKFKGGTSGWVLNSFSIKKATPSEPVATIFFNRNRQFMQIQVDGGNRKSKAAETLLRGKGVLPAGMGYLPGKGATRDTYGNLSSGTRSQVLSFFQVYMGSKARSNRKGATLRSGVSFFALQKQSGKLAPGVYQRVDDPQTLALRAQRALIAKQLIRLRTTGFGFAKNSKAAKDLRKRLTAELAAVNKALQPRGTNMVMAFDTIKTYQPLIRFYALGQAIVDDAGNVFNKVARIELGGLL